MSAALEVVDRAAWLSDRMGGVGASEAAAAIGVSPYETPLSLYLRKLGLADPPEETEAMRLGTLLEPVVGRLYAERTGRALGATQVFRRHDRHPHVFATLDGIDDAGNLVELKTIGQWAASRGALGDEDTDQVPEHWIVQAHQQMAVFDAGRVEFGVLVGGQSFRHFAVERDEGLVSAVVGGVDAFWRSHVEARVPPAASAADVGVLSRQRPAPGRTVRLDDPLLKWAADAYLEIGEGARVAERLRDEHKAALMQAMGDAERAELPDGTVVTRKLVTRKEHVVKESTYVSFSIRPPKEAP